MKIFSTQNENRGFAMLFTVLIITLVLSIAIGISNLSLKQMILSSLAKDSQISFYEADTAVECGLYYDSVLDTFPVGTDASTSPDQITCGNNTYTLDSKNSLMDYIIYKQDVTDVTKPCSSLYFDKASSVGTSVVQGRGYNICDTTPRQVERVLEVRYYAGGSAPTTSARNVTWVNNAGVLISGNSLTKMQSEVWGNSGASSAESIPSGDGYVEFSTNENTTYKMAGLSNGDSNVNWDDIDYGAYPNADGTVHVYEAGSFKGNFTTYVPGDVFRVAVESGVVHYYINGVQYYVSATAPTYPLLFDTALYSTAATITNAKIYP